MPIFWQSIYPVTYIGPKNRYNEWSTTRHDMVKPRIIFKNPKEKVKRIYVLYTSRQYIRAFLAKVVFCDFWDQTEITINQLSSSTDRFTWWNM